MISKLYSALFNVNYRDLVFKIAGLSSAMMVIFLAILTLSVSRSGIFKLEGLSNMTGTSSLLIGLICAWLLLPLLMPLITSVFIKKQLGIMIKTEPFNKVRLSEEDRSLSVGLKVFFWGLALQLICFPLYLIPWINIMVYISLNAMLLGKHYIKMMNECCVQATDSKHRQVKQNKVNFLVGVAATLMALIPILNLITPYIMIVILVHIGDQNELTKSNES